MALKFDAETMEQMKRVENTIAQALIPIRNSRIEGMIVVFALVRVARQLLVLYPKKARTQLVPVLTAFLEEKKTAPGVVDDDAEKMIWTPEVLRKH